MNDDDRPALPEPFRWPGGTPPPPPEAAATPPPYEPGRSLEPSVVAPVAPPAVVVPSSPQGVSSFSPNDRVVVHPVKVKRAGRMGWILLALLIIAGLGVAAYVFWDTSESERDRADAAEASLVATEAKVTETEQRISELTNEKAQVQDERNAAKEVSRLGAAAALEMVDCRDRLLNAMAYLAGSSLYEIRRANTLLDAALPVCQSANAAIDAFVEVLD